MLGKRFIDGGNTPLYQGSSDTLESRFWQFLAVFRVFADGMHCRDCRSDFVKYLTFCGQMDPIPPCFELEVRKNRGSISRSTLFRETSCKLNFGFTANAQAIAISRRWASRLGST